MGYPPAGGHRRSGPLSHSGPGIEGAGAAGLDAHAGGAILADLLHKEVSRLKEELHLAYKQLDQRALQQTTPDEASQLEISVLHQISRALLSTIDREKILYIILTCVTAHPAFGFSRAFLLLVNEETRTLEGKMGVGPRNAQEAYRIWQDLSKAHWGLEEFLAQYDRLYPDGELPLDSVIKRYRQALQPGQDILVDAALSRLAFKVEDAVTDTRVSAECLDILACNQFVVVPLVTGEQAVGVIVADNLYKDRDISPWDMRLLRLFANHAAMALQNAATYAKLQDNIDQLRAVQEQLIQAERLSAIGQMTAKVAHEIRNPLVTIGGFARSVLKGLEKDSPQSRRCEIIVEETMRLEEILGSLLDFSRQRELHLEDCRIEKIIARACTLVRDDLVRNKVVIQRDIQKGLPDLLLDVHKIVQVLINLVKNAIQAMKEGGEITLSAHLQGRFVSLKVADTGTGIPPGILSNIFNPFFTTKSEGFGLGLAISRNYIYDHGGNISVQSRVGEGTVFDILLPLPSVPATPEENPAGEEPKGVS
jgi:signal transduction histidine kinase